MAVLAVNFGMLSVHTHGETGEDDKIRSLREMVSELILEIGTSRVRS